MDFLVHPKLCLTVGLARTKISFEDKIYLFIQQFKKKWYKYVFYEKSREKNEDIKQLENIWVRHLLDRVEMKLDL